MLTRWAPLACISALALMFTGLLIYAASPSSVGTAPPGVRYLPLLAALILGGVSVLFGWRIAPRTRLTLAHALGVAALTIGLASFYVFTEPTTIKLGGGLAFLGGMVLAGVTAVMLAAHTR